MLPQLSIVVMYSGELSVTCWCIEPIVRLAHLRRISLKDDRLRPGAAVIGCENQCDVGNLLGSAWPPEQGLAKHVVGPFRVIELRAPPSPAASSSRRCPSWRSHVRGRPPNRNTRGRLCQEEDEVDLMAGIEMPLVFGDVVDPVEVRERRIVEEHVDPAIFTNGEFDNPLAASHCREIDRMEGTHLPAGCTADAAAGRGDDANLFSRMFWSSPPTA